MVTMKKLREGRMSSYSIIRKAGLAVIGVLFFLCAGMVTDAQSALGMDRFPNVEISPDGTAWRTVDGGAEELEKGTVIHLSSESNRIPLLEGQHYYGVSSAGREVRVGYWKVQHSPAQCIHGGPSRRRPPLWAEEVRNKCVCRALARRDSL